MVSGKRCLSPCHGKGINEQLRSTQENAVVSEELIQIRARQEAPIKGAMPGVYIKTFGCQMNEYDSEKLLKLVEPRFFPVDAPDKAELILINTCSVRDKPEQKLYSLLGEMKILKDQNPNVLIGVGGCVAQQEGEAILKRSATVDFVFGTHNLSLVPSLIDRRRQGLGPQVAVDYRDEWEELPAGFTGDGRVSVFVSISRGCNKNCTYCIVPTTRGAEVSRAIEEIKREVRIAAHRGAREITLLGQTVNSYGLDLTPRRSFVGLLEELSQIEGIERIRFTSPHPQEIRSDFVELVCSNPKICRHVHMPLQSGSDRILKLMNRNYRRKRYLGIIEEIKARVPDMAITTDVIVGFPGETEADFQETMEILEAVQFDNSFSFMFSPRPGTPAAAMEETVSPEEKLERLQRFQARQFEITTARLQAWVGKTAEVLLEGPSVSNPDCLQGRISQNITLNLDAPYPQAKPGQILQVEVQHASRYTLRGKLLSVVQTEAVQTEAVQAGSV